MSAVSLVVCGWLAIIVALTFGAAPGTSMAVIGPPSQVLPVVARANGRILISGDYVTIARSDDAGFVARLYAAGALLVLDAEQAGGCSGLPPFSSLRAKRSNPSLSQDRYGLLRFARNDADGAGPAYDAYF